MSSMSRAMQMLRGQSRMLGVMGWTSIVIGAADVVATVTGRDPREVDQFWKKRWYEGMAPLCGLSIHVTGKVHPGQLVISNHRTPLDIVVLSRIFRDGHFLANHKVEKAPIIGNGAKRVGTIFVERGDRKSGANAIRTMRRLLEERKTLLVFPEGTTFGGDEVRPFRPGAFTAASGMDIDIVPVGLAYKPGHEFVNGKLGEHVFGALSRTKTDVWVTIGEPMKPSRDQGFEEMARMKVQQLVNRSRLAAARHLGMQPPSPTMEMASEIEPAR